MRFRLSGLMGVIALAMQAAPPQNEALPSHNEPKQVMTTVAETGDSVRMSALQIDKDWADSTVHLSGQVRLVVGKFSASGIHAMVITADEATLNERTGEITPSGHVQIAPYPNHRE